MVTRLIMVNVGIFLLTHLLLPVIAFLFDDKAFFENFIKLFCVPAHLKTLLLQPWSILTYMFLHDGIFHILFNMIFFYVFGGILLDFLGNKKIFPVYLLGGLAGATLYIIAYNIFPVFQKNLIDARMLGASAAVMATVFAAATLRPNYEVKFILLPPIKIKYFAVAYVLIDLAMMPRDGNAGGHIAHLGGAMFGFLFINQLQKGVDWSAWLNNLVDRIAVFFRIRKPRPKKVYKNTDASGSYYQSSASSTSASKQEQIDAILDKIREAGYDSLSKEEKDFLFRVSKEE